MNILKKASLLLLLGIALASCGTTKITTDTTPNKDAQVVNFEPQLQEFSTLFTDEGLKNWHLTDPFESYKPGMSVEKAFRTLLKDKPATTVIVAIVDAGIDINHEDLKEIIWINEDEIPNNGIDDDKNGYIDDVNGWNFLGHKDGRMVTGEQLEMTRIVKKYRSQWKDKSIADIDSKDAAMYKEYKRAEEVLAYKLAELEPLAARLGQMKMGGMMFFTALKKHLNTEELTAEAVRKINTEDENLLRAKAAFLQGFTPDYLKRFATYVEGQTKYHLNLDFEGRIQGDDLDDITDIGYGNNNVIPPNEDELHGTHVGGIVAQVRNNAKGGNGVSDHVLLMPLRAVPDGDEYDKDIALAFRYAVDNGAKVINCSFGKYFSPHKEWVWDAIKYAEKHDVLIVNGVGNEGKNMDNYGTKISYPNDGDLAGQEIADNFLNVGAVGPNFGANMVADFSNYGKETVDVFSPGVKIYATVPFSKYKHLRGTSMASPNAAGVAALIRSRFPNLTASQVKHILMDSGMKPNVQVIVPQEDTYDGEPKLVPFADLSKSGAFINAYNALLMAEEMSK